MSNKNISYYSLDLREKAMLHVRTHGNYRKTAKLFNIHVATPAICVTCASATLPSWVVTAQGAQLGASFSVPQHDSTVDATRGQLEAIRRETYSTHTVCVTLYGTLYVSVLVLTPVVQVSCANASWLSREVTAQGTQLGASYSVPQNDSSVATVRGQLEAIRRELDTIY